MINTLVFTTLFTTIFAAIDDSCNLDDPTTDYNIYWEEVTKDVSDGGSTTKVTVCQLTECLKQTNSDTGGVYGIVYSESPILESTSETAISEFCEGINCEFDAWILSNTCECPTCPSDPTTTVGSIVCASDEYTCLDTTVLSRDPTMDCTFPCPEIGCDTAVCCGGMPYERECKAQMMCDLSSNQISEVPSFCPQDDVYGCPTDSSTSVTDIQRNVCCEFNTAECCVIQCPDATYSGYYGSTAHTCYYKDENMAVIDTPTCGQPTVECTEDVYECLDGTTLSTRVPPDCNFACPEVGCDTDVCCGVVQMTDCQAQRECDRDIFALDDTQCGQCDCSEISTDAPECTDDVVTCSDETVLSTRLLEQDCDFVCPNDACNSDVCCVTATDAATTDADVTLMVMSECDAINGCDGTVEEQECTEETKECPDGSHVVREGPCCFFADCPCETDVEVCCVQSDGREEGMDLCENDCDGIIEERTCTADAKECPSGASVGRDACCAWKVCGGAFAGANSMKIFVGIVGVVGLFVWM